MIIRWFGRAGQPCDPSKVVADRELLSRFARRCRHQKVMNVLEVLGDESNFSRPGRLVMRRVAKALKTRPEVLRKLLDDFRITFAEAELRGEAA